MKIIIVGGVAGGATAAARLRRLDENAEILLIERGEFVSFANCGLPYYIGGAVKNRDALFVLNIAAIESKYNVKIRNFSEAIRIDREDKTLTIKDLKKGMEYDESYDKLLLSTGSHPFVPDMKGLDAENVFTLWNIPDVDKINAYIQKYQPRHALVAGSGFIGLEMAENLKERGLEVCLVEFADQLLPPFDPEMAKLIQDHLAVKGIRLLLETGLSEIRDNGKSAVLSNGETLSSDMILLSIGVRPNSALAKDAGLRLNARGGIVVDSCMRTDDPDIYAIGDVIEVENPIDKSRTMTPLAGPANKQGRAVAANLLGKKSEPYPGTIGTSVIKIFDLTAASTGMNEKQLKAKGMKLWKDYGLVVIHPLSHAGYYPGAVPMTLKLLYSMPEGRVLGAQIVGYDGIDKRIDTIATAIHFRGSIYDLTEMELAYAPPYSSAKDPVNMAGYAAANILEKLSSPITQQELDATDPRDDWQLLDIREEPETAMGMIPGAIRIPLTALRKRMGELNPRQKYIVYCAVGLRGYIAERILKQKGFTVRNLIGGFRSYGDLHRISPSAAKLPTQDSGGKGQPSAYPASALPDSHDSNSSFEAATLDACGLSCPGPILRLSQRISEIHPGDKLTVKATDPGFIRDIESWCETTGNRLLSSSEDKGIFSAEIQKGNVTANERRVDQNGNPVCTAAVKEKTMIVFDGDLDKAIAAFIIAAGSAAMGSKVNMFFTFWGLNILRKPEKTRVKKDLISSMFSIMMPRGTKKLRLSKMNFGGLGSKMMRSVMKKKGISSLEELIHKAQKAGVKMTACQMSMDVMGLSREELIDGVEVGGVASMLNDNDHSNMNLFI